MSLLRKMKIHSKLALSLIVFVVGVVLFSWNNFFVLFKVKINGPLYTKVVQSIGCVTIGHKYRNHFICCF